VEQLVSHTRFWFVLLGAALVVPTSTAGPGILKGKKTDPARVPALIEALKSDTDERKRKAAADELGRADARLMPEVMTALVTALQKDPAAVVRAEAADSIGQLPVSPLAGMELEAAASGDSSPLVRLAAKKALWEYHLNGYRSPKGADGITAQTIEPPIASPAAPRPASAVVAVPAPTEPIVPLVPRLPATPLAVAPLPPIAPPAGPRLVRPWALTEFLFGPRTSHTPSDQGVPVILNVTAEPPIAKRAAVTIPPFPLPLTTPPVPPPTVVVSLPPLPPPPEPDYVPTLPPFTPDLPSVVLPPDETPMPLTPVPTVPRIPATLPPLPQ
jgi:hypothetical protein